MKYLQAINDFIKDVWHWISDQPWDVKTAIGAAFVIGFLLGKI
jgi:ElaB/YqjD/DUF883 family membrane-anchored ribosome-binding protein